MRTRSRSALLCLLCLLWAPVAHAWPHEGREVGPGLIYRTFSGPIDIEGAGVSDQEIFVVYVDTWESTLRFVGSDEADKGIVVSEFASRHDAEVAINTNFFSLSTSDSCGLMAGSGTVWSDRYDAGGACADSMGIGAGNLPVFFSSIGLLDGPLPEGVSEVATGMPFLVRGGTVVEQDVLEGDPYPGHTRSANPRTAVCQHEDGRSLVLAVVDGRASGRVGMRAITLARFMRNQLGCVQALNLDGGGSSTLFVGGEPGFEGRPAGVVNRTSDGRERGVCCHLGVVRVEDDPLWAAELVTQSPSPMLALGEEATLRVEVRNIGRRTWQAEEVLVVADAESPFATDAWRDAMTVGPAPDLGPGASAEIAIPIRAPSVPASNRVRFLLWAPDDREMLSFEWALSVGDADAGVDERGDGGPSVPVMRPPDGGTGAGGGGCAVSVGESPLLGLVLIVLIVGARRRVSYDSGACGGRRSKSRTSPTMASISGTIQPHQVPMAAMPIHQGLAIPREPQASSTKKNAPTTQSRPVTSAPPKKPKDRITRRG